jgi:hypothetical protein
MAFYLNANLVIQFLHDLAVFRDEYANFSAIFLAKLFKKS